MPGQDGNTVQQGNPAQPVAAAPAVQPQGHSVHAGGGHYTLNDTCAMWAQSCLSSYSSLAHALGTPEETQG